MIAQLGLTELMSDSYPSIEVVEESDYSKLIAPFDLDKSLVRFYIMDNDGMKSIFYELHHIISDGTTRSLIDKELDAAFKSIFDKNMDLGFLYASCEDFESKFEQNYKSAHEFFIEQLEGVDEIPGLVEDVGGSKGRLSLPIPNIRDNVLSRSVITNPNFSSKE